MPDAWYADGQIANRKHMFGSAIKWGVGGFGSQKRKEPLLQQSKEMKEFRLKVEVRSNESHSVCWG